MKRRKVNTLNSERQAQRHAVQRWLLSTTGGLAVLGLVAWAGVVLHDPATLPLRKVEVKGEFIKVSAEQVQALVATERLAGFFNTDVDAITRDLRALPWVEDVSVRRVWPDKLHVTVLERRALARWNSDALVTATGDVFKPATNSFPEGLPELQGPQGSEKQVLTAYINMNAELQKLGKHIVEVGMNERRAWSMQLDDGMAVELGREEHNKRLQRFVMVYENFLQGNKGKIDTVDLRYTNGFTVRWKQTNEDAGKA